MSRIARIVGIRYPHHIIQRGNNRQQVFFDDKDRQFYLELLKKYSIECSCKINAYCLMNNHIHILAVPRHENSLAKTMQKLSLRYTQHINKKYQRTGRLWECRFHSCLVDKESYLWTVCRYIEKNPVRAGIISEPCQYRWSSAKINTTGEKNDLVEPIWQDYFEKEEYVKFLNQSENNDEIKNIRKNTLKGMPVGKEGFSSQMAKTLGIKIQTQPKGRPRKHLK